ncbi:MAG: hypothetical protein DMF68_18695 [Acidobacteria bacterium]|nr:MAG: hypothetical protein DMF68_18695 [Acidobacteriota bacterium]
MVSICALLARDEKRAAHRRDFSDSVSVSMIVQFQVLSGRTGRFIFGSDPLNTLPLIWRQV